MKVLKIIPGIILSVCIAILACWIESLLPIHLIGSAVIAMFVGMLINHYIKNGTPKEDLIDAIKYVKDMEKYLKRTQGFHKIIHKPMCFLINNNILFRFLPFCKN